MKPENLEYWKQLVVALCCHGDTVHNACRGADEIVAELEERVADITDPLVPCGNCDGNGCYFAPNSLNSRPCPICGGRGEYRESELPKRD